MIGVDMGHLWASLGITDAVVDDQAAVVVPVTSPAVAELVNRKQLLSGLDDEQRAAVLDDSQQLLVVASAGSGKTRVFVHRIARLVLDGADPGSILALSYTNAAADEVKRRLAAMGVVGVQTSTMHAWCHRGPMRTYGHLIGKQGYRILDADGQEEVLRYDMHLGEFGAKQAHAEITVAKNFVDEVFGLDDSARVAAYDAILASRGQLDFDDLQVGALRILQEIPEALLDYRRRFTHVLIDEYQDVNPVQHEILRLLCAPFADEGGNNLPTPSFCVVGDPDQSIFQFRGSDPSFIHEFTAEFPDAEEVILDRNYRSTAKILAAADQIVSHNHRRIPKTMRTDAGAGRKIDVQNCLNELNEARVVSRWIEDRLDEGVPAQEIAVLYRRHAQSEILVEVLHDRGVRFCVTKDSDPGSTPGVRLSTIHSAKGLEYHSVALVGWYDGNVPMYTVEKDPDLLPEERRIAYVAITRAKRRVLITYPVMTRSARGYERRVGPSRFLESMRGNDEIVPVVPRQSHRRPVRRYDW